MNTARQANVFDLSQLPRLTEKQILKLGEEDKERLREQYADWLDEISDHYMMVRWQVCLLLRRTFKWNNDLGTYLTKFRERKPGHALSLIDYKTFSLYIRGALFCERYKITDLYNCGLSPTVIYEITKKKHEPYLDRIYHQLKRKSYTLAKALEIIQAIHDSAAITDTADEDVLEIEKEPESHEKRLILVENNVAKDDGVYKNIDLFAHDHAFDLRIPTAPAMPTMPEPPRMEGKMPVMPVVERSQLFGNSEQLGTVSSIDLSSVSDAELLLELASREAYSLSNDEILTEVRLVWQRYGKSALKTVSLLQEWVELERPNIYKHLNRS